METIEQQINLEPAGATATNENNQHNPGLRALLSLRNCNITLEKEYGELLEIEAELDAMNKTGLLMIATHCNTEMQATWIANVQKGNDAIEGLNKTLEEEKEKIRKKEITVVTDLWNTLSSNVNKLR